jgi:hypothetical protein
MCLQAAFAKYDAYSNNTEEEFVFSKKKAGLVDTGYDVY